MENVIFYVSYEILTDEHNTYVLLKRGTEIRLRINGNVTLETSHLSVVRCKLLLFMSRYKKTMLVSFFGLLAYSHVIVYVLSLSFERYTLYVVASSSDHLLSLGCFSAEPLPTWAYPEFQNLPRVG